MNGSASLILYEISVWAIPAVIAITFHEASHGYVAHLLGDDTAWRLGRVSFNPLVHVDPFGTILLPVMLLLFRAPFLFGYAKPVPVNFAQLRHPKRDMIWVAAAGPGMNILLAILSVLLIYIPAALGAPPSGILLALLWGSVEINLVLAIFNLIPLPPLDGGRVAVGLLPLPLARPLAQLSRYGILPLLVLLVVLPYAGIDIFHWLVEIPVQFLERPALALLNTVVH